MELSEGETAGWYVDEDIPTAMKEGGCKAVVDGHPKSTGITADFAGSPIGLQSGQSTVRMAFRQQLTLL